MFHFSQDSRHRRLFSLALPMILSNITVPLLGLVDTAVIGHLPHAYYLGATSVGAMIITFITWLCGFLRMSSTGLTAQAHGAQNPALNQLILARGILVALVIALLFILAQHWYIDFSLQLAGASLPVQQYAREYCSIRIYGLPAALANLVLLGWLLGNHRAKAVMWLLMATNIINVLLDLLLVVVFDFRVAGVAVATLIAEYAGLLLGLALAHNTGLLRNIAEPLWPRLLNKLALLQYLKLNRDILLRTLCLEVTFVFITFQGARLGDNIVAANAILLNFLLLISFGLDGIANAAEVMVGHAKGANDKQRLLDAVKLSLLWTGIFALLYSLLFALFGNQLISVISDLPDVVAVARQYLFWLVLLPLLACWCYLFDGVYIGLMRAHSMRNSMIIATFACFFPSWFLLRGWGNHGLWAAFSLFMLVRGLTLAWDFNRYRKEPAAIVSAG